MSRTLSRRRVFLYYFTQQCWQEKYYFRKIAGITFEIKNFMMSDAFNGNFSLIKFGL